MTWAAPLGGGVLATPTDGGLLQAIGLGAGLAPVSAALRSLLPEGCRLAECSGAGEITHSGYRQGGLVAVAFPDAGFAVETVSLAQLSM